MHSQSRIFVAGHRGMVGSAICRQLTRNGYTQLLTASRSELDLINQAAVHRYFQEQTPEVVILAAAKVGGIHANNTYPADFIYDNMMMEANVIHAAFQAGVKKLLFLGSSCIYPKLAPQPMPESCLLSGELEPTNKPYAIAKIAGIVLCESYNRQHGTQYISAMPTNLYGPNDNYHLENSHVIPALIRKFHDAKESGAPQVEVWGTGTPKREFLHVNDLASASVFLLENYSENELVNVGTGSDVSIGELAALIAEIVGFNGELVFNTDKPDGTPRKLLDVSKINQMGWSASISLSDGLAETYEAFNTAISSESVRL